jgi:hypothetical protein
MKETVAVQLTAETKFLTGTQNVLLPVPVLVNRILANSVAKQQNFFATPAPGNNFDEDLAPNQLYRYQSWASLPPEVTVKSLPLPTNLKIVTVNSFSLPA